MYAVRWLNQKSDKRNWEIFHCPGQLDILAKPDVLSSIFAFRPKQAQIPTSNYFSGCEIDGSCMKTNLCNCNIWLLGLLLKRKWLNLFHLSSRGPSLMVLTTHFYTQLSQNVKKGEKNLKKMGNHNTLNRLKFWFSGMSFKSPINIKCMEYPQIA